MGGDGRRRRMAALAVAAVAVAALVVGNHGYVAHRRTKNHQKSGARTDGSDGNSNGDGGGGDTDGGAINVCALERKTNINLFCYCDETDEQLATSADCWVFNDGEPRDSPVWHEFRSQPNIAKLTFNVRGQTSRTLPFVPTDALAQLPALRTLEIVYAGIGTVHTHAFANLSHLQDLALVRNGIMRLARESVAYMPDLRVATLGDNAIDGISNDVFAKLPSLRKLYMDRNNISYVAEGAFEQLRRLEELDMSYNRLTGPLSRYVFLGLVSLKRLDMHANRLDRIGPDTFAELVGLEELALDDNALRVVDGRGFAGLPDLQRLTVAGNRLTALHDRTFGHRFDKLRYVDVRHNRLRALPYAAIEPLVDRLRNSSSFYLYLQDNAFVCDCSLLWMNRLAAETINEHVNTTLSEVQCLMNGTWPAEEERPGSFKDVEVTATAETAVSTTDGDETRRLIKVSMLDENTCPGKEPPTLAEGGPDAAQNSDRVLWESKSSAAATVPGVHSTPFLYTGVASIVLVAVLSPGR